MALSKPQSGGMRESILTTLLYHDIFDFPLTKEELWKFLVSKKIIERRKFEEYLKNPDKKIVYQDGYFALAGRDGIIKRRRNILKFAEHKLEIAKKAAEQLSAIPTIVFIGISGGLAIGDADRDDDIDFFIITRKDSIFKTRLMVLLVLHLMGIRRKRKDKNPADKICVNFFIDETELSFPAGARDLYLAHEIAQLTPLFNREATYIKFIKSNKWISDFLPNVESPEAIGDLAAQNSKRIAGAALMRGLLFYVLGILMPEGICRALQKRIIKRHRTSERITNHLMAFNPKDYRLQTIKKLRLGLRELGLLTRY